jgi:chromosome segregation ATPase
MKTIEELEAALETVTRERDLSLSAWESAGMAGRTAQSAMLELTRQFEEARDTIVALTTAMAEKDLEIATLTAALDERDLEAERSLEQYESLVRQLADAMDGSTHWQVMCKRETEEVERLTSELQRERIGIRPVDEVRSDAYRRGAEAMREKAAAAIVCPAESCPCKGALHARIIRALPIPEEP